MGSPNLADVYSENVYDLASNRYHAYYLYHVIYPYTANKQVNKVIIPIIIVIIIVS
jgi:hypothetical protein